MLLSDALTAALSHDIVGQEQAVRAMVRALTLACTWPRAAARPLGFFLVLGPTGTGKTRLAYALARCLYGDPRAVIPLHVAGLAGGPAFSLALLESCRATALGQRCRVAPSAPGYPPVWAVGAVLVLDEVEKADASVVSQLCEIADTGFVGVTGSAMLDLRGAFVLLKSRIASGEMDEILRRSSLGFQAASALRQAEQEIERSARRAVQAQLAPALLGRLDDVLLFRPVQPEHLPHVLDRFLADIRARLAELGAPVSAVHLTVAARRQVLGKAAEELHLGLRPLFRLVRDRIEFPLVDLALSGMLRVPGPVVVDVAGEALHFSIPAAPAPEPGRGAVVQGPWVQGVPAAVPLAAVPPRR
jgi:ATP-dependent Clp protease ATP-binding subunit ClpC